jgi:hypothetical protein
MKPPGLLGYFRAMIKYLFIVINSFCIFIFGFFTEDNGITVTSNIPANIVAGQDVAIEIKVNKGGQSGFAKLQLDLPEGITIKEAEDKGANYSYNAGIAKWVWAALPTDNEIVVKITLVASETSLGAKTITSKYSFVENNNKQMVEMTPAEVNVLAPGSDPNAVAIPTPSASKDSSAVQTPTTSAEAEPPGNVTAIRSLSAGSTENEFLVTVKIKKGNTKGFARFSDDIAEGIIVRSAKTDGGSFSVADGKIKFVWVNVPDKEELEISYTLKGSTSDPVMLGGEYSYLEDNQSKKYKLPLETIAFMSKQVTKEESKEQGNKEPENANPATTKSIEETLAKTLGDKKIDVVGEKKENGLNYHVQVGAFTNAKVTADRLKRKFKIKEKITSDMEGGFSKFMIGSYDEYKVARDKREVTKITNGVKSAFVVAYNQGKRITVQEALMITNQKWFK